MAADDNGNDRRLRARHGARRRAGAFELVSARDGGDDAGALRRRRPDLPLRNPGADVGRRRGDLRRRPTAWCSARRGRLRPAGARRGRHAAGPGVRARSRAARRTRLVTRVAAAASQPAGARRARGDQRRRHRRSPGRASTPSSRRASSTASSPDPTRYYYLWRRVADGPGAPTRRITGPADARRPGLLRHLRRRRRPRPARATGRWRTPSRRWRRSPTRRRR